MFDFRILKKNRRNLFITVSVIFILIYFLFVLIISYKLDIPSYLLKHFVYSLLGMVCLTVVNLKFPSSIFNYFTMVAATYYIFTSFGSICFSLLRNDLSAFQNLGILENTEAFLFFTVLGYIFLVKKDSNKDT